MRKSIKRYFITGLLLVVPLYISVYVFILIVTFMDSLFDFLPLSLRPETYLETYLPFHIPGAGLLAGLLFTLAGIFVVGLLAANLFGRKLVNIGESILARIPFLSSIYKATKQFMETFFVKEREGFRRVVLLEYPRKGLYSIGFVTGKTKGEIQASTNEETINLFIPTTPNPTSGYYIAIPEKDIIPLSMSVEDAFKVVMTGGMVVPLESPPTVKGEKEE
jgi:uncharacterized membrane protein